MELYRQLAADLMQSERPANLDAEELEQYDLLLEEQAFPFEEKASEVHERNARHAAGGLYDEWVRKSYAVLAELQPARFGKQVEPEAFIAELVPIAPSAGAADGRDSGSLVPPEPSHSLAGSRPAAPAKGEAAVPAARAAPMVSPESQQQFAGAVLKLEAGDFAGARPILEQLVAALPTLAERPV